MPENEENEVPLERSALRQAGPAEPFGVVSTSLPADPSVAPHT